VLVTPLGDLGCLSLDGLTQPGKHLVRGIDGLDEVADCVPLLL
jgi:hypothetical protein